MSGLKLSNIGMDNLKKKKISLLHNNIVLAVIY